MILLTLLLIMIANRIIVFYCFKIWRVHKSIKVRQLKIELKHENPKDVSLHNMEEVPSNKQFSHRDLKEMSYSQRFNNLILQRKQSKTPDLPIDRKQNRSKYSQDSGRTNNGSKNTNIKQQEYTTKCHIHNQSLLFFCQNQKKFLCIQCMYKHTRQNKIHKVISVKNSIDIVTKQNGLYKQQTRVKLDEVQRCLRICQANKSMIKQTFQNYMEFLKQQFQNLLTILKHREEHMSQCLKSMYLQKQTQLTSQINNLSYIRNCLKQYHAFPIEGNNSQVYFFNAYTTMKLVIDRIDLNFKLLEKQQFLLLQKGFSLDEFKITLQKYLHFRKQKKSDSVNNNFNSSNPQNKISQSAILNNTNKSSLNQQIKNAKKRLEKLEKMQKQEKNQKQNNYLNNYTISLKNSHNNSCNNQKCPPPQVIQTNRERKRSGQDFQKRTVAGHSAISSTTNNNNNTIKPITPSRVSSKYKSSGNNGKK